MEEDGYHLRGRVEPSMEIYKVPCLFQTVANFRIRLQASHTKIYQVNLLNRDDIVTEGRETDPFPYAAVDLFVSPWELVYGHSQSLRTELETMFFNRFRLVYSRKALGMVQEIYRVARSVVMGGQRVSGICVNIRNPAVYMRSEAYMRFDVMERVMMELESANMNAEVPKMPAFKTAVDRLEKVAFDGQESCNTTMCLICQEDFEMKMQVTRMPCGHLYHGKCIGQWLEQSHSCPLCRFKMPVADT